MTSLHIIPVELQETISSHERMVLKGQKDIQLLVMCSSCVERKHGLSRLENWHASFRTQVVNGPVESANLLGWEKMQWAENSVLTGLCRVLHHPEAGRSFFLATGDIS